MAAKRQRPWKEPDYVAATPEQRQGFVTAWATWLGSMAFSRAASGPSRAIAAAQRRAKFQRATYFEEAGRRSSWSVREVALYDWLVFQSWSQCPECKVLSAKSMTEMDLRDAGSRAARRGAQVKCVQCKKAVKLCYPVPRWQEIPACLQALEPADVYVLRPLVLHQGTPERHPAGYLTKAQRSALSWKPASVASEIDALADIAQRRRCGAAYAWLCNEPKSAYASYISVHERFLAQQHQLAEEDRMPLRLPGFRILEAYLECCLWPHLHPFRDWCPSHSHAPSSWKEPFQPLAHGSFQAEGDEEEEDPDDNRMKSAKAHYTLQVKSEILDYGRSSDLLQWHFDVHVFRKVAVGQKVKAKQSLSPQTGDQSTHWNPLFWQFQHAICMDVVAQLGPPDLFLTVSPWEWSLPWPYWLERARRMRGLEPTELPGQETLCLAHLLVQVVRGFLCGGTGPKTWRKHVFADASARRYTQKDAPPDVDQEEQDNPELLEWRRRNVRCVLARHEFQEGDRRHDGKGRGAMHVHVIIWLLNAAAAGLDMELCATLPAADEDPELRALALRLQCANEAARVPQHLGGPTWTWDQDQQRWMLKLRRTPADQDMNLRPFLRCLLRVLRCAQDVQWWFGKAALLAYVLGYTVKAKEDAGRTWALDTDNPWAAGDLYSKYWLCAEPQMMMTLAREPMVWTSAQTKKIFAPAGPEHLPAMHQAYCRRSKDEEHLSYLEFLRLYREIQTSPFRVARYKASEKPAWLMAVGVLYHRLHRDSYFWQWLLFHWPHRSLEPEHLGLREELLERVAPDLRWFAVACALTPDRWGNEDWIRRHLLDQGHRLEFVENTVARLATARFLLEAQQAGRLPKGVSAQAAAAAAGGPYADFDKPLNAEQNAVLRRLWELVKLREEDNYPELLQQTRPVLLTGVPGSGKSFAVVRFLDEVLRQQQPVLVAAPAAKLGVSYREKLRGVVVQTVHKAFQIPVHCEKADEDEALLWPKNLTLQRFRVIVVDEASLLAQQVFEHIYRTWAELGFWPVLIFVGDFKQLLPFVQRTAAATGPQASNAQCSSLWKRLERHELRTQVRCTDSRLRDILGVLRDQVPDKPLLRRLRKNRVFPRDTDTLRKLLQKHEGKVTVLAGTRRGAAWANRVALDWHKENHASLGQVPVWNEDATQLDYVELYVDTPITMTFNQSEERGLMNGQPGVLKGCTPMEGRCAGFRCPGGLLLELGGARGVELLPPTYHWIKNKKGEDVLHPGFHLEPGYATTVYKAQGATLDFAALLLDAKGVPGLGYVAVSRVRRLDDLIFLGDVDQEHFYPVPDAPP
ncbi:unnamed protein product [Symbiodinium sp. CCMP2592]|nr:unnamed protein product [Symbiodinium sp. CCMP2592]